LISRYPIVVELRFNVDMEEKMFVSVMQYRPFSIGEGIRGMRPIAE